MGNSDVNSIRQLFLMKFCNRYDIHFFKFIVSPSQRMKQDFTQTCSESFHADQQSFQLLSEMAILSHLYAFIFIRIHAD